MSCIVCGESNFGIGQGKEQVQCAFMRSKMGLSTYMAFLDVTTDLSSCRL